VLQRRHARRPAAWDCAPADATPTWSPGAHAPSSESTPFDSELILDRSFLNVTDGSVSRAENAPRIRPLSLTSLEIGVPEASAHPVVAIEGIRFEALQQGIPPANEEWKVAPGELSRPGRVVVGERASLALVRQIAWDREGGTHHLMLLPRCVRVRKGEKKTVVAPAVVGRRAGGGGCDAE
jgi:hypothetical protein